MTGNAARSPSEPVDIATAGEDDLRRECLRELAAVVEELAPLRATVRQATRTGPLVLRVVNPDAGNLCEEISCEVEPVGHELWFSWSWGDAIGLAEDLWGVAHAIARVLRPDQAAATAHDERRAEARAAGAVGERDGGAA
jgi:hypothetical protein